jgi:hypothetical protein
MKPDSEEKTDHKLAALAYCQTALWLKWFVKML